jgi:predicted glycogen debranching enzyme
MPQMTPVISFDSTVTRDFARASSREWLETNGLGGWASSTICGAHTRRYHGLMVVATEPPVGRIVLLSKLDESLVLPDARMDLSCAVFPGAIHPQGHHLLTDFSLDPFPIFTYSSGEVSLRKTVAMINNEHTVVILYELLRAPATVHLELRPLFAGRDYHHLVRANQAVSREGSFGDGILHYQPYPGQPVAHILVPDSSYDPRPDWYYNYYYQREEERGLDFSEDLFTPGVMHCPMEPGTSVGVVISTQSPQGRDAGSLLRQERVRRHRLTPGDDSAPVKRQLVAAADQFLVRRADGLHTILAGYHWFADWGRDTMIALPGICLVTGHFAEARSIFQAFGAHISDGLIPNRFSDYGQGADYNTVDATLWYFVALYKHVQYTEDYAFVEERLWETLKDIVNWHRRGTQFGIGVDPHDGLLQSGEDGTQLTWMDAKVDDWVVTPRQGKAVEVNALWYNACRIMEHFAERFGEDEIAQQCGADAKRVLTSFRQAFWNEAEGCLFDVIGTDWQDAAVRPNQILALSLPFPLLEGELAAKVFGVVDAHLFTPCGLRSLSPRDPAYESRYMGDQYARDGAYHQGTVWGWLIGPFITALVRTCGEDGRVRAATIVARFAEHLSEAGLGSVSEIFDAESPFVPRGCIAQAWSVGELLRAQHEDVEQATAARQG